MKAQRRGRVDFDICVMHAMEPPQCVAPVKRPMLRPDREIENQKRRNNIDYRRQFQPIQDA